MFKKFYAVVFMTAMFVSSSAFAGITLVNVAANPGTWASVTTDMRVEGTADLGALPDFGGVGINGPLTSAGSGVVPAGFVPTNITFTSDMLGSGGTQPLLFGLGPSLGAGNPENAILVNDSGDAMVINFADAVDAFEFSYVSWLGGGPITMEVTRDSGFTTFYTGLLGPITGGNRYGVAGNGGEKITSIRLLDLGSGFEGITGSFSSFQAIPEPGSLGLLALGLACGGMRRRSKT